MLEPPAEAKQRKREASEAEIATYMRDRAENAVRMREYVEQHNLRNVDPLGASFRAFAHPAWNCSLAVLHAEKSCCRAQSRCFQERQAGESAELLVH